MIEVNTTSVMTWMRKLVFTPTKGSQRRRLDFKRRFTLKRKKGCKKPPLPEKGVCIKCFKIGDVTTHHLYPLRFFKGRSTQRITFLLCEDCHLEIEGFIPEKQKMEERNIL